MNGPTIKQSVSAALWQMGTVKPCIDQPIHLPSVTPLPLTVRQLAAGSTAIRGANDKVFPHFHDAATLVLCLAIDGYRSEKTEFCVGPGTTRAQLGRDAARVVAQYMDANRKYAPHGDSNCDLRTVTADSATLVTLTCFSGTYFTATLRAI